MSPKVVLQANAKINLTLDILGKRSDNYHDIQGYVAFLDLHDELIINHSEKLLVSFDNPFHENVSTKSNTILKLHSYLCNYFPNLSQYKVHVMKNIPISAGLGGGSCDAAALLRYLISDRKINIDQISIESLARNVGADVPCCLLNGPSFISGIGEIIQSVKLTDTYYCLLVNPQIPISTSQLYEKINIKGSEDVHTKNFLPNPSMAHIISGKNDFQQIIIQDYPIIGEIINNLTKAEGCVLARMTGSGPTCFGFFSRQEDMSKCKKKFEEMYPKFWIMETKLLN